MGRLDPPAVPLLRRAFLVICALLGAEEALVLLNGLVRHRHVGPDFAFFYVVSGLAHAREFDPLASPESLRRLAEHVAGWSFGGLYPWAYPPMALLVVYPLAFVPLRWALGAAMLTGIVVYASAVLRIAGFRREVLLAAIVFPAVSLTVGYGHMSLLTAGLLGWGLAMLPSRPLLAGLLLGALSFKPHLVVLVPVALVAGRRWRALIGVGTATACSAAVATVAFGFQPWIHFFRNAALMRQMLPVAVFGPGFQSVFGAARLAGGSASFALAAQMFAAAGAAVIVWRAWSGGTTDNARSATLVVATLLVSPYLWDYDLTLLAIPIAFFFREAMQRGWREGEQVVLVAAAIVPIVARESSEYLHLAIGPCCAVMLLWVLWRRARDATPTVADLSPPSAGT